MKCLQINKLQLISKDGVEKTLHSPNVNQGIEGLVENSYIAVGFDKSGKKILSKNENTILNILLIKSEGKARKTILKKAKNLIDLEECLLKGENIVSLERLTFKEVLEIEKYKLMAQTGIQFDEFFKDKISSKDSLKDKKTTTH
jgi:hypothetical protein